MGDVQPQSLEGLVKMDHFQKEPPIIFKGPLGHEGGRKGQAPKGTDRNGRQPSGLLFVPLGALRHLAPPSRDFFVGCPNGRIGRFLR